MLCLECTTLPRGKANWRQYFKDTADSAAKYDCRFSRPTLDCFILSTVSKTVWPDSDARPWFLPMIYKLLRYNRLVKDSAPQCAPNRLAFEAGVSLCLSFFFFCSALKWKRWFQEECFKSFGLSSGRFLYKITSGVVTLSLLIRLAGHSSVSFSSTEMLRGGLQPSL